MPRKRRARAEPDEKPGGTAAAGGTHGGSVDPELRLLKELARDFLGEHKGVASFTFAALVRDSRSRPDVRSVFPTDDHISTAMRRAVKAGVFHEVCPGQYLIRTASLQHQPAVKIVLKHIIGYMGRRNGLSSVNEKAIMARLCNPPKLSAKDRAVLTNKGVIRKAIEGALKSGRMRFTGEHPNRVFELLDVNTFDPVATRCQPETDRAVRLMISYVEQYVASHAEKYIPEVELLDKLRDRSQLTGVYADVFHHPGVAKRALDEAVQTGRLVPVGTRPRPSPTDEGDRTQCIFALNVEGEPKESPPCAAGDESVKSYHAAVSAVSDCGRLDPVDRDGGDLLKVSTTTTREALRHDDGHGARCIKAASMARESAVVDASPTQSCLGSQEGRAADLLSAVRRAGHHPPVAQGAPREPTDPSALLVANVATAWMPSDEVVDTFGDDPSRTREEAECTIASSLVRGHTSDDTFRSCGPVAVIDAHDGAAAHEALHAASSSALHSRAIPPPPRRLGPPPPDREEALSAA